MNDIDCQMQGEIALDRLDGVGDAPSYRACVQGHVEEPKPIAEVQLFVASLDSSSTSIHLDVKKLIPQDTPTGRITLTAKAGATEFLHKGDIYIAMGPNTLTVPYDEPLDAALLSSLPTGTSVVVNATWTSDVTPYRYGLPGSATFQVQSGPVLRVTYNGAALPRNAVALIAKGSAPSGPTMPSITATLFNGGAQVTGNVSWSLNLSYPTTQNNFSPLNIAGSGSSWTVPWNDFMGGTAVLSWSWENYQNQTFTFNIRGENPDSDMVNAALQQYQTALRPQLPANMNATPWFLWQIVQRESIVQQFGSDQLPYNLAQNGNGWGLMQLDPPPSRTILWNWNANIQAGVGRLSSKLDDAQRGAYNFWLRQVVQWHEFNQSVPQDQQYGVATQYSPFNCKFWMIDDQYGSPPAGYHSFADAIWIKQYNGTGTGALNTGTGNFIVWQKPGWHLNLFDDNGRNYVNEVCFQMP